MQLLTILFMCPHNAAKSVLAAADWIVSMGCDLTGLVPPGTTVVHWDDIPPSSQDLLGAKQAIVNHLVKFVNQLVHVKQ